MNSRTYLLNAFSSAFLLIFQNSFIFFYLPPPRVVLELLDQILDPSGEVRVLQLDPEVYKRVRSSVKRFFAC
jgi:hypothetical protein